MKLRSVLSVFSSVLCLASCCNRGGDNGNGNGNGGGSSSSTCESSLSGTCLALLSGGKCSKDLCGSFQQDSNGCRGLSRCCVPWEVVAQEAPCSSVGGTCQKASSSDECSGDGDVLLHGHCPSQPECVKCCAQAPSREDCLTPTGDDCLWYSGCLEPLRPCAQSDHPYAVGYGDKYCKLYEKNYEKFSSEGQRWVDAVRKCLQVELAPVLNEENDGISCEAIQQRAFDSHACCYVEPEPGSGLSFCSLSFSDQLRVVATIKSAFLDAFGETLSGILQTGALCVNADQCNAENRAAFDYRTIANAAGAA